MLTQFLFFLLGVLVQSLPLIRKQVIVVAHKRACSEQRRLRECLKECQATSDDEAHALCIGVLCGYLQLLADELEWRTNCFHVRARRGAREAETEARHLLRVGRTLLESSSAEVKGRLVGFLTERESCVSKRCQALQRKLQP